MRQRNRLDDEHMRLALALSLRRDANCIDVGAHDGAVLRLFAELAPVGKHVAYEPLPHLAEHLRATFPTVDVHQAVVADVAGESSFAHVLNDPGRSGMRVHNNFEFPPEVVTLDGIPVERLDDLPLDYRPDVIKIDVEGAELQVLRGAVRLLTEHQPVVFFEHFKGGSEVYGTTPEQVFELLTGLGHRIFDIDGVGPLSAGEMRERFDSKQMWQFVAHA